MRKSFTTAALTLAALACLGSAHAGELFATGVDVTSTHRTATTVGISLVGGGQGVKAAQPGIYWLRQSVDSPIDFAAVHAGGLMAQGPAAGLFQVKHDDGSTKTAGWAGYSFSRVFSWGTLGTVVGAADFGRGAKLMVMPRAEIGLGLIAPQLGTTALSVSLLPKYLGLGKTTAQIGLDVSF